MLLPGGFHLLQFIAVSPPVDGDFGLQLWFRSKSSTTSLPA